MIKTTTYEGSEMAVNESPAREMIWRRIDIIGIEACVIDLYNDGYNLVNPAA